MKRLTILLSFCVAGCGANPDGALIKQADSLQRRIYYNSEMQRQYEQQAAYYRGAGAAGREAHYQRLIDSTAADNVRISEQRAAIEQRLNNVNN